MLKVALLFACCTLPHVVFADTYLCVAEKAAGVVSGGKKPADVNVYNPEPLKWVMTEEKGKRVVKKLGDDYAHFDKCDSEWFCESSSGYAGVFLRGSDGDFTVTWITKESDDGNRHGMNVAAGRCSKL